MHFDELIGKTLTVVILNLEKDTVEFRWEGGRSVYTVEGDCCSTSWIDSFEGAQDLIGSPIVKVYSLEMVDTPCENQGRDHACDSAHESLAVYGYRFETINVSALLDFRNDSNGYYGGYLVQTA